LGKNTHCSGENAHYKDVKRGFVVKCNLNSLSLAITETSDEIKAVSKIGA